MLKTSTDAQNYTDKLSFMDVRNQLAQLTNLPAMPNMAAKLLRLSTNERANVYDLIKLIETDPSLVLQLIRYAKSAFFGYRGHIESIEQAVISVLGYRLTLNISLGVALGREFTNTFDGPMGIFSFWKHAVYHAVLMEHFARRADKALEIKPDTAYLCGLLHDFGILLIGHLFKRQTILLNQMIKANPDTAPMAIEQQLLGTTHNVIGAWLMEHWQLPNVIQSVVLNHHNQNFDGAYQHYVKLAYLGDSVLSTLQNDYPYQSKYTEALLVSLGLSEIDIRTASAKINELGPDLDRLASSLAA